MWWEKAKTRFESLMIRSTFLSSNHTNFKFFSQRLPWLLVVVLQKGGSGLICGLATSLPFVMMAWGGSNVASISCWTAPIQPSRVICIPSLHCDLFFLLAWHPGRGTALKPYEGETKVRVCPCVGWSRCKAALILHHIFDPVFRRGETAVIEAALCFQNGPYLLLWLQDMNRYLNAFWKSCHGTL